LSHSAAFFFSSLFFFLTPDDFGWTKVMAWNNNQIWFLYHFFFQSFFVLAILEFELEACEAGALLLEPHFQPQSLEHQKENLSQVPVAHTYNPSYLGGWDWKNFSWRPVQANSSWDLISTNSMLVHTCHPTLQGRLRSGGLWFWASPAERSLQDSFSTGKSWT
jgi:hypothetical protein